MCACVCVGGGGGGGEGEWMGACVYLNPTAYQTSSY